MRSSYGLAQGQTSDISSPNAPRWKAISQVATAGSSWRYSAQRQKPQLRKDLPPGGTMQQKQISKFRRPHASLSVVLASPNVKAPERPGHSGLPNRVPAARMTWRFSQGLECSSASACWIFKAGFVQGSARLATVQWLTRFKTQNCQQAVVTVVARVMNTETP